MNVEAEAEAEAEVRAAAVPELNEAAGHGTILF